MSSYLVECFYYYYHYDHHHYHRHPHSIFVAILRGSQRCVNLSEQALPIFIRIHLLFSYLTYRQHHTGIAVNVNRQLLYKAHRNEINDTYTTYSKWAKPKKKSTSFKHASAFKKKYILRNFVHKIRAGAGKQYAKQNIEYRFYLSQHISLYLNTHRRRYYRKHKLEFIVGYKHDTCLLF